MKKSEKKSPFFTVITVCLNAGFLLEKTVRSVLSQDFGSYQYIIKDGVSSDGSFEALPSASNVELISIPDEGIYDAMNQALEHANGRYVCFLNAGDTFASNGTLSRVFRIIRDHPDKAVYFGHARVGSHTKIHPTRFSSAFLYDGHLCHQAAFVGNALYSMERGFNARYRLLGDRDFFMRALWVRRVPYFVFPLVVCNYDPTGITTMPQYEELKNGEFKEIQKSYFRLRHRIFIWIYLHSLVRAKSLIRKHLFRKRSGRTAGPQDMNGQGS